MFMKKLLLILITISIISGLAACRNETERVYISADWQEWRSIEELASEATHVLRVEVLNERLELLNRFGLQSVPPSIDPYELYTIHQVRILEVFQGDVAPGDIIDVAQVGGRLGNIEVVNKDHVSILTGGDFIFFLFYNPENPLFPNSPAGLMNPWQAIYHVASTDGGISNNQGDNATNTQNTYTSIIQRGQIESLPGNDLTLTIEDLKAIAEQNKIEVGMPIQSATE